MMIPIFLTWGMITNMKTKEIIIRKKISWDDVPVGDYFTILYTCPEDKPSEMIGKIYHNTMIKNAIDKIGGRLPSNLVKTKKYGYLQIQHNIYMLGYEYGKLYDPNDIFLYNGGIQFDPRTLEPKSTFVPIYGNLHGSKERLIDISKIDTRVRFDGSQVYGPQFHLDFGTNERIGVLCRSRRFDFFRAWEISGLKKDYGKL